MLPLHQRAHKTEVRAAEVEGVSCGAESYSEAPMGSTLDRMDVGPPRSTGHDDALTPEVDSDVLRSVTSPIQLNENAEDSRSRSAQVGEIGTFLDQRLPDVRKHRVGPW